MSNMISVSMRDVLIAHIDGTINKTIPVILTPKAVRARGMEAYQIAKRAGSTRSLLVRGFLSYTDARKTHTVITEAGREILAELLADYVEALVQAGYLEGLGEGDALALSPGVSLHRTAFKSSERLPSGTEILTNPGVGPIPVTTAGQ